MDIHNYSKIMNLGYFKFCGRSIHVKTTDEKIILKIEDRIKLNADYWDFKANAESERDYVHNMFAYPAMMVPKMQRELLSTVIDSLYEDNPGLGRLSILDPFVGSGTILVEGMLKGLNVAGIDINPLAILICKVKTTPLPLDVLNEKINELKTKIDNLILNEQITRFDAIDKWFKPYVILGLDRIKAAIRQESDLDYRRFFWVCFCQTVRNVSNSRTCTYKLHIKSKADIENFNKDVIALFKEIIDDNYRNFALFINELSSKKLLSRRKGKLKYKGKVDIIYGDSKKVIQRMSKKGNRQFDLLFTSPPYGDNHTTVTYGQYSVLQLRWIDINDIGIKIDNKVVSSLSEIDRQSLGGIISKQHAEEKCSDIIYRSGTLFEQVHTIKSKDEEKIFKIVSFYKDLDWCIENISRIMKTNSYLIWIVGNRKVAYEEIRMNEILVELSNHYNLRLILDFKRGIYKKRMPDLNAYKGEKDNLIGTMKQEIIMIFRKHQIED